MDDVEAEVEAADVIALANRVLEDSGLSRRLRRVTRVKQCNSVLFSSLYQALTGSKITEPSTSEDTRCQAVIDALTRLLPDEITLEHISGADIAQGDLVSISNLLDVFGILVQSTTEAEEEEEDIDDSNLLSSEGARVVDEVLQEELGGHTCSSDSTAELLQRVPSANLPPTATKLLQRLRESAPPLSVSTSSPSPPSTPCSHRIQTGPLHQSTPHEGPRSRLPPPPVTNIHSESIDTTPLSISTLSPRSESSPPNTTANRQTHSQSTNALLTSDASNHMEQRPAPLPATQSASSPTVLLASPAGDEQYTLLAEKQDSTEATAENEESHRDSAERPSEELLQQMVQKYMSKKSKVHREEGKVKKTHPSQKPTTRAPSGNTTQDKPKYHLTTNLLPLMEETFPKVDMSSAMERKLWHVQMKQMTALTSSLRRLPTSSSCQAKTQEVQQRQAALMNIIRKDLAHTRRLQALNDQKKKDRAVQISDENNKMSVARSRRYFNDYELSLRGKLQKMRTREEQVVKNAFQQCLALQKERVRDMRVRAKEKQNTIAQEHSDHLESMEKFYQDRLQMMSEKVSREKEETAIREKAQREVSQRLQRELRKKMESDVEKLHGEMRSWEEDCAHFRELDANMLLTKIQRGLLKI